MMVPSLLRLSTLTALCFSVVAAEVTTGRPGYGLVGYGITMYKPSCAYACLSAAPKSPVFCSNATMDSRDSGTSMRLRRRDNSTDGMVTDMPSTECLMQSEPYLTTIAWCLFTRCKGNDADVSTLENFWKLNLAGRQVVQPLPSISYQAALFKVTDPPQTALADGKTLNTTALVPYENWLAVYNGNTGFEAMEDTHEKYGLVLLITGVVVPIGISLLRFVPFPVAWVSTFNAYFIDPPAFGRYHAVPVLGLAIVPTRGQAFFIFYVILLNVVLSATGYSTNWPNSWWPSVSSEVANYVADQLGLLSFANMPLVFLYGGRNNFLLWLTNWSHSTYLLLHRWIGFICMLQAVLHSAIFLQIYLTEPGYDYMSESKLPYWYWGIIGTLALALLIPLSVLPLRKKMYELFLASHVVLSILAVAGCWYHIIDRFEHQWGYETWLYVTMAVWAFDRLVRFVRMMRNGVKRAYVTVLDADYVRIDIPGLDASGHIYAYFPTLTWRVWENHPFSVAGVTAKYSEEHHASAGRSSVDGQIRSSSVSDKDPGGTKAPNVSSVSAATHVTARGATFFVRVQKGATSYLASKAATSPAGIPVLIESSYGGIYLGRGHASQDMDYPNQLCIAGGVGITAVLPLLNQPGSVLRSTATKKLYWGVRSQALVDAVETMVVKGNDGQWGNVEVLVSVGERLNVGEILKFELVRSDGSSKMAGGVTVIVCGPPELADEVRYALSGLGRHNGTNGAVVRLVEESFSW